MNCHFIQPSKILFKLFLSFLSSAFISFFWSFGYLIDSTNCYSDIHFVLEILLYSIPLAITCAFIFYFLRNMNGYLIRTFVAIISFILIAIYFSFRIFKEREACYTTYSHDEIVYEAIFNSLIPSLILGTGSSLICNAIIIKSRSFLN